MNTKPLPARRAGTAIAAVLALTATPLFAQDAAVPAEAPDAIDAPPPISQPESITGQDSIVSLPDTTASPQPAPSAQPAPVTPVSPTTAPSAAPSPTVAPSPTIIPETVTAESQSAPAPQAPASNPAPAPAPQPSPSAEAETEPAAPAPAPVAAPANNVTEEAADAAPATTDVSDEIGSSDDAFRTETVPLAAPVDTTTDFDTTPVETGTMDGALESALGLLLALGVGIFGIAALRRSRKKQLRKGAYYKVRPTEPVRDPVTPVAEPVPAATHAEPVVERDIREWAHPLPPRKPVVTSATAGGLANTGAAVPLPSSMPESFEERDALIRRMVAAKPDRANPFVSPKARLKRARLILQSLDRTFENNKPWIDLSQYPRNWPELARQNQSAAA